MGRKSIKVYCEAITYLNFFKYDFNAEQCSDVDKSDVLILTGGPDVGPSIYGANEATPTTASNQRDNDDLALFGKAAKANIPIIGICRGAQLLTIMAGGTLFQDVTGHFESHPIEYTDRAIKEYDLNGAWNYEATSMHHQMMNPYDLGADEYEVLAYSNDLSAHYLDGDDDMIDPITQYGHDFVEPEIVIYPNINGLAIQGHPERNIGISNYNLSIMSIIHKLLN